ncbi:unnamed protein product [Sphagnum jensenii]|uniref:Uncharacterized protein n=1 Tax=Sphagnum jensenii TaxID=128206 RepID=A0ABP0XB99_9BRYO
MDHSQFVAYISQTEWTNKQRSWCVALRLGRRALRASSAAPPPSPPPPPLSSSSPPQQQQRQQSQTILGTTKIPHNSFCIQTQKRKILQILVRFRSCSNSQFASPILS